MTCVVDVRAGTDAEASPPNNERSCVDGPFSPWKEGPKYVDFQTPALPTSADVTIELIKVETPKCTVLLPRPSWRL